MIFSVVLFCIFTVLLSSIIIWFWYETAFHEQEKRLLERVKIHSDFIDRFQNNINIRNDKKLTIANLYKLIKTFQLQKGFGETGEFTLAQREGNKIKFLLTNDHLRLKNSVTVVWNSPLAEPMRLALNGQSGVMVGLDYRGKEVLAAYQAIDSLNMGIVAKIDLREINSPFFKTIFIVLEIACVIIVIGVFALIYMLDPILNHLAESEERFRALFEGPLGIFVFNTDKQIIEANAAFCKMLNYTKSELLGLTIADITDPQDIAKTEAVINTTLKDDAAFYSFEKRYLKKDGSRLWGNIVVSLIHNKKGEAIYSIVTVEDISRRKQEDEKIRQVSMAIEQSPNMVVITNLQGDIEYVNPKFTTITGYKASEVIGINPGVFKSGRQSLQYYKNLWSALLSEQVYRSEVQNKKKDGSIYWEYSSFSAIKNEYGEITNFIKVAEDISDRKQVEVLLKQAKEEAESANRAKSEFLANMTHELRTPMNAVIGFSQLLSSLVTDNKQRSYLHSIQTAGKSLLALINDILDLSKIEAGQLEIHKEAINLEVMFQEIQQIFSLKTAEKGLDFIVHIDENLPKGLLLDEIRLRQVLLNLVGNAVKFTKTGSIKLFVEKLSKNDDNSQLDLLISVADTGIGIDKKEQAIIFESFRQQSGQSNREYGGTGLGLSISKRLIELMNGKISVQSTLGMGSIFEITLFDVTIPENTNLIAKKKKLEEVNFEPAKILVVDDIESNRNFIKEWLYTVNLEVLEAQDGHEALRLAEECQPDVILMDIRMPIMDGYEATNHLKANKLTQKIPVIALTASIEWDNENKKSRFDGFLYKPINTDELLNELFYYLNHKTKSVQPIQLDRVEQVLSPELRHKLEITFMPVWKEMNGFIELEPIEKFAEQLMEFGMKHDAPFICDYGKKLLNYTQEFDTITIEEMLNEFPNIVKG
jgi:PAS domain S-box-containing protein